jgi:hypothetical protein
VANYLISAILWIIIVLFSMSALGALISESAGGAIFCFAIAGGCFYIWYTKYYKENNVEISKIQNIQSGNNQENIKNIFEIERNSNELQRKENNTVPKNLQKHLAKIIFKDEEIKNVVTGQFDKLTYSMLVTNKRMIMLCKTLFQIKQIEIPIEKINSIGQKQGLLYGEVNISDGSSKITLNHIPKKDVIPFINAVNEQVGNYKTIKIEHKEIKQDDEITQIERLSDLYKSGNITDYEYSIKKQELLNK